MRKQGPRRGARRSELRGRRARTAGLALTAATLLVAAAGCGSDGTSASTSGDGSTPPKVAYLSFNNGEYVQAERAGLQQVLDAAGGSYTMFDSNFDPQKQLQQCQDAITSGRFNGLLIGAVDGTAIQPCITQARNAKLPVVAIENPIGKDRNAVDPQVDGVVGSVVYTGLVHGKRLVPLVEQACAGDDRCHVLVEVVSRSDPYSNTWLDHLRANLPANATIDQVSEGQYDSAVTAKTIPDVLRANPDADVAVFEADNNALTAIPALKQLGMADQVALIGDGGSVEGAKAVADGRLFATTPNWPRQMGERAGRLLIDAIRGTPIEQPGVDALALDEPELVTAETVEQFTAEWPPAQ